MTTQEEKLLNLIRRSTDPGKAVEISIKTILSRKEKDCRSLTSKPATL